MSELITAPDIVADVLANFIRITLLLGCVWLATHILSYSSAAIRSSIWTIGLISLLLLPLFSVIIPNQNISQLVGGESTPDVNQEMDESTLPVLVPPNAQRITDVSEPVQAEPLELATPIVEPEPWQGGVNIWLGLLFIWFTGVAGFSIYWVRDYQSAKCLIRKSRLNSDKRLQRILFELMALQGVDRKVSLVINDAIGTPFTIGIRRPVIVLPEIAIQWPDRQVEATLLHELAHIKRYDIAIQFMSYGVCTLYWLNPFVWLAARKIKVEQEKACDDFVLRAGMLPVEYAEHLLAVAKWSRSRENLVHGPHAIAMAQEPMLKRRMRSVLKDTVHRKPFTWRQKFCVAFCMSLLVIPLAAVTIESEEVSYTYLWYEAEQGEITGLMQIEKDKGSSESRYVVTQPTPRNSNDASAEATLTIQFEIPRRGEYIIWGRILAPSRKENSYYVSVDGKEKVIWDTQGPDREMTATVWAWDRIRHRYDVAEEGGDPVPFYFESGRHTLQIMGREAGTGIDKILITDNPVYRPRSKGKTSEMSDLDYIWVEPEKGEVDAPMQRDTDGTASNESFVWTPESNGNPDGKGTVLVRFEVKHADFYTIWGRVLAPSQSDNSFFVSVDGQEEILWDVWGPDKGNTAKAWWWVPMRDRIKPETDSLKLFLEPGIHALRVRSREAGTRLDRILVTNDDSFVPEGWGTAPDELMPVYLWMEAEDAVIRTPLTRGTDEGASNGGYIEVSGQHQSTSSPPGDGHASFYVSVPVDGTYLLWGRVLAPRSGDSFWLRIDGKRWVRWNGIQHGQGWHWEEVHDNIYNNRVLSIELQKGRHHLEIAYREKNTKLDGLLLTNDFNYVPAASLDEPVVQKRELLVSAFRD